MMEIISYAISSIFICITIMYVYFNIHNLPFRLNKKHLIILFINIVLFIISPMYLPPFHKQMFNIFIMFFVSYYAVTRNVKNAIVDTIYLEIICVTSEIIYTLFYMFINVEDLMLWNKSFVGILLTNTIIPLIMILINKTKLFKNLYSLLMKFTNYLSRNRVLLLLLSFFAIVNILFYVVYYLYYSNKIVLYIIIVLIFFLYTIILFVTLYTSNNYEKMKNKYSLSLENLKGYEEMLNQYRISNHENKNQLLLIRNMVKNKKAINYIDELIDYKEKDDSNIYNIVKRIPISSIRAVIYSKALLMDNKKILYDIKVARNISSKSFDELSDSLILDICNILNVFLDNAIDAVSDLTKKQVLIEFTKVDDKIEIAISNLFDGEINLNQIYVPGYSTKGSNRGYGLSVVKKIIDSNSKVLSNSNEVIDSVFTQYLYIKIKREK